MLDLDVIQVIVQGGAVGLLLMFGVLGYRFALAAMNKVSEFVNNHLEHNTEAVREGTEVMKDVANEVRHMSGKLDVRTNEETARRLTGWEDE